MANNEPKERCSAEELLKCQIFEAFKICKENGYIFDSFIASHSFSALFSMKYLKTNQQ